MSSNTSPTRRTPVYFLGIGGPNFIENTAHPAFARLAAVGREITTVVKPKAVVVFSAHWQSSSSRSSASSSTGGSGVEVNVAEDAGIIYDFYGFPPHFYEYNYPYRGSPAVAEKVIEKLAEADIGVKRVKRGLDHGVWAGFLAGKALLLYFSFLPSLSPLSPIINTCFMLIRGPRAAFDPVTNPLDVPIVQVSLYGNEDSDQHYRLGAALQGLRDEGILIVGAGMAVHNLRDYRRAIAADETMPYVFVPSHSPPLYYYFLWLTTQLLR